MDGIPPEIIQRIFQYIDSPNDKKSFHQINKLIKSSISKMQIRIIKMEKELKKIEEKNQQKKSEKEKKCINNHNCNEIYFRKKSKRIGMVILYYPYFKFLSEGENEKGIDLIIKKQFDFQANKRISKKIMTYENKSKLLPLTISQEIMHVADNLLRKEDCKNGNYIERNIPYCWNCIKKHQIIDEECIIIKRRKYNKNNKN